jgi:hypothetical protein
MKTQCTGSIFNQAKTFHPRGVIMLICPQCKSEYQESYKICSDCKCDLIEITDPKEYNKYSNTANSKNIIIGIAILIASILLYIGVTISTVIYALQLTEWYTDKGKIGTALTENGLLLMPFIISTIMFILGVAILLREYTRNQLNG